MIAAAFLELAHACLSRCRVEEWLVGVADALLLEEIGKNAGTVDHLVAPDRRGALRYSSSQEDAVADTAVVLDELHELGLPARP